MRNIIVFCGLLSFAYSAYGSQESIDLPAFDEMGMDYWDPKIFAGTTEYLPLVSEKKKVLEAKSEGAASGLMYREKIDLLKTPYIRGCLALFIFQSTCIGSHIIINASASVLA